MSKYSELTVERILNWLIDLPVTKVVVDNKVVWSDDNEPWVEYEKAIKSIGCAYSNVDTFSVDVVHFHHLEVDIKTIKECK